MARLGPQGPRRSLAVSVDDTFAKVVGRHGSDEERQRLYRLRDALGLRDNDAFWSIVIALECDDSFFRRYLAELAEHAERCIEDARAASAAAAEPEAAHARAVDALGEGRGEHRRRPPAWTERPLAASAGDDALGRGGAVRRAVRDRRATAWRGP